MKKEYHAIFGEKVMKFQAHQRIGVIDIGSNSVHLVVGVFNTNECFSIIDDAKVNVRLCEGFNETGMLQQDRMDLGIKTLSMFRRMCDAYALDKVVTVATAAVRKASNGDEFCRRAEEEAGIHIEVIPGEQEAAYDYLGVVNTLDIRDALMMDIGGGSCEFVLIKNRQKIDAVSLPFGSIDLAEKFNLKDKIKKEDLNRLTAFLDGAFMQYPLLKEAKGLPVVGVGGTIRNIGRIHRHQINYPLEIAHNYHMTQKEVKSVYQLGADLDFEGRRNLKGLSKGRTDIFVGASRAVYQVMKYIKSDELIISDAGLRDGIIWENLGWGENHLVPDVYEMSMTNVMANHDVNAVHAMHMYRLCKEMYEMLEPLHHLNGNYNRIIQTSALLHDCGIKIAYHNHHEHSFYLILNSGLCGISQKELLISAFAALHHRINKKIQIDKDYECLLTDEDKKAIDLLGLLLQIGEQLDRSMDGSVSDVSCKITDEKVIMTLETRRESVFADMIIDDCGKKFKRIFDRELVIESSSDQSSKAV